MTIGYKKITPTALQGQITPYIVDPSRPAAFQTVSGAIDAVVADGTNDNSELPALILLAAGTYNIGTQLRLPPNIRICGPADVGYGYQQASRRSAILEGTILIDVETDVVDGVYFLSDLELTTTESAESCVLVSGTNSNPQVYIDGVTLDHNGGASSAGTAFESTATTTAAFYFYECHVSSTSTKATLHAPNSNQSILVRGTYLQGSSDAINAGSGVSVLSSRCNGVCKGGTSAAGHQMKYSEFISTTGNAAIAINATSQTIVTHCFIDHPTAAVRGTAGGPLVVRQGSNAFNNASNFPNCTVTNI